MLSHLPITRSIHRAPPVLALVAALASTTGCQQATGGGEDYTVEEAVVPPDALEPPLPLPKSWGGGRVPTPRHCPGPRCAEFQAAHARNQIVKRNLRRYREQLLDEAASRERYLRKLLALPNAGALAPWERALLKRAEERLVRRITCIMKWEDACGSIYRERPPDCDLWVDPRHVDPAPPAGSPEARRQDRARANLTLSRPCENDADLAEPDPLFTPCCTCGVPPR